MATSIKQIAKMCGVSEGTVDRALKNRTGIKEDTKQRILNVAKELDYTPNHFAQCLATGCTKTIGVVCFNICNSFFASLIESIEIAAKEQGYFINLILTQGQIDRELDGIRYLSNRSVDGLILFSIAGGEAYIKQLKNLNIPVVTIYNKVSNDFAHIDVDCRSIMKHAVSFIKNKGYDNIAYIDIDKPASIKCGKNIYSFEERYKGYLDGIEYEGMKPQVFNDFLRNKILEFIEQAPGKKAVLCSYDTYAVRILSMCRQLGIKVPENVGLMGFNNIEVLDDIYPRIYSVDCNIRKIGHTAFNVIIKQLGGDKLVKEEIIDYSFSNGETL